MRVLEVALAGVLALSVPVAGHADPVGSPIRPRAAGPAPNGWNGDWRRVPGISRQWNGGSVLQRWWPNGPPGWWACCLGPSVPTYWVWGPSGGAFDYPVSDWRGPTGGWGNP